MKRTAKILTFTLLAGMSVMAFAGCEKPHEHALTKNEAKTATCTEVGNTEYYSCECGKFFEDAEAVTEITSGSWVTEATGHTPVKYEAKTATCTEVGNTEYYSCACGKFFEDAEAVTEIEADSWVIEKEEHVYDKGVITTGSTATTNGVKTYTCINCPQTKTEDVLPVVGGVYVNSLEALVTAFANGGTVVLENNIVSNQRISVAKGKEVVLDLNGYTLSGAFNNQGTSALLYNEGTLTVKNGKVVSLAQYPDVDWGEEGFPTYASNTITNRGGVLTIEEGAIIENETNVGGASYAIDNQYGWNGAPSKVFVNGGLIKAKDVAIRVCASTKDYDNYLEINDGTIVGKRAIWIHLTGSDASVAPKATVVINGGTLSCHTAEGLVIYSYSYGNSFANTNVTINGGTFLNGWVAFGGGYTGDTETVTVNSGVFEYDVFRYLANDQTEIIFSANK